MKIDQEYWDEKVKAVSEVKLNGNQAIAVSISARTKSQKAKGDTDCDRRKHWGDV